MSSPKPSSFSEHPDVMISSTYDDLVVHRQAVIDALLRFKLFPIVMELDSAKAGKSVIESSMEMLKHAHAYIGIVSHRYGSIPQDIELNPRKLSVTELEYREALRLRIPVYMFLMSDNHQVRPSDVETVGTSRRKLHRLKVDAKRNSVCAEFSSVEELKSLVLQSMAEFKENFRLTKDCAQVAEELDDHETREFALPPELVAVPNFVSGHEFIGRRSEMRLLDAWARTAASPIMLVESIGGAGKSTLVWEWIKERVIEVLPDLAGTFWYSFYQGVPNMDSFAAHALAYVCASPISQFSDMESAELLRHLMNELRKRKFLLVLDGLERVLVAYQHIDAPQTRDDKVSPADNNRACIRPTDENLLREFVGRHKSKIVVTSRLIPTALTNKTSQLLTGVQHWHLGGLESADALRLMKNTGVRGDDSAIQRYVKQHFDNHPLMVGIVAGLINDYVRDPGNFDRWLTDPQAGGRLNPRSERPKGRSDLLESERTHIIAAALQGLEPTSRKLLSRIAALSEPVSFETVVALSPFIPPGSIANDDSDSMQTEAIRRSLPELVSALQDLERRGLLQWNRKDNTYDLHPVVRGYAFELLEEPEQTELCNQLVDHFQRKPTDRYEDAKSITDVQQSINISRLLVQAKRFDDAAAFFIGNFSEALILSIEAYHEVLMLLNPFFPEGFDKPPIHIQNKHAQIYVLNCAGIALRKTNQLLAARQCYLSTLNGNLARRNKVEIHSLLVNFALVCFDLGNIASACGALELALELAQVIQDHEAEAITNLHLSSFFRRTGNFDRAGAAYDLFTRFRLSTKKHLYRVGDGETESCWLKFYKGELEPSELNKTKILARNGSRETIRNLERLEGELSLQNGDYRLAISAFQKSVEMTQQVGLSAQETECRLALVFATNGDIEKATDICLRLTNSSRPPHVDLAEVYVLIGDRRRALEHGALGYVWAWGEGGPHSFHWELDRCRSVFRSLAEPEPNPFRSVASTPVSLPCEKEVRDLIESFKNDATLF